MMQLAIFAALLAVPACPATSVGAAGRQDDTYTNKDYQVTFKSPGADYELKGYAKPQKGEWWSWGDTLAEIRSKDSAEAYVSGVLLYFSSAWTVEKYAKWREDSWKENKSNTNVKRIGEPKKVEKKSGSWVVLEITFEYQDSPYHYLHLIGQKGKHNLELILWSPEGTWADAKPLMEKVIDSFQYGETTGGDGGAKGTKVAHAAFEVVVPEGWTHRDKEFQLGVENTVLELQHAEKLYGLVLVLDSQTDPKPWAEKALENNAANFENWKVLDAKTAFGGERRDCRGDKDGTAYRMAYLFLHAKEAKKNVCFWIFTAEGDWKGYESVVDALFSSVTLKGGGGGGGGGDIKVASTVEVPEDLWKGFGVGTTVAYKMTSAGTERESHTVLLAHTEGKEFITRTDSVIGGNKMEGQAIKFVVKKVEGSGGGGEGEKPEITEGDEEIEVPAGKFKCHWIQTKTSKYVSKVWQNKDVPGSMVKVESEVAGSKTSMVLIKFEKK